MSSNPTLTFFAGLLGLILFFWYFATDYAWRRRILGTVLTLLVIAVCIDSFWPQRVQKTVPFVPEISSASTAASPAQPLQYEYKQKINFGLDLKGGTSFLIRLKKEEGRTPTKEVLDQAVEVIRKRVDAYGIGEPVITPEGQDRILVQIPGLEAEKIAEAREQLKKVAKLEFRLVHPQSEQLIAAIEHGVSAPLVAPFKPRDADLFAIIGGFEAQHIAWNEFQNNMERYWCLRWLQQQQITTCTATVIGPSAAGSW